ncbi:Zn-ribbon domain-containing OB-fold protein [Candidatus Bathyarchaeota archaeon]|nr:Zn-ribbon domain-containing OB-fold protein [Candidatus Bathyarchaeota archaeon]
MSQDRPFTAKSFYDFVREKVLMGCICQDCKTIMVPPRMSCIECGGERLRWSELSGKGSLETFTIVHVAPAFLKDKAPYAVGIVRLEEGPMITARLVGLDVLKPETFKIGMPMVVGYADEGGRPLLVFRPA